MNLNDINRILELSGQKQLNEHCGTCGQGVSEEEISARAESISIKQADKMDSVERFLKKAMKPREMWSDKTLEVCTKRFPGWETDDFERLYIELFDQEPEEDENLAIDNFDEF